MGNYYIGHVPHKEIHVIIKGRREKDCSICEEDLVNERDMMVMFDHADTKEHFYVCRECLNDAVKLLDTCAEKEALL